MRLRGEEKAGQNIKPRSEDLLKGALKKGEP